MKSKMGDAVYWRVKFKLKTAPEKLFPDPKLKVSTSNMTDSE